jgi:hypothetical protein
MRRLLAVVALEVLAIVAVVFALAELQRARMTRGQIYGSLNNAGGVISRSPLLPAQVHDPPHCDNLRSL